MEIIVTEDVDDSWGWWGGRVDCERVLPGSFVLLLALFLDRDICCCFGLHGTAS